MPQDPTGASRGPGADTGATVPGPPLAPTVLPGSPPAPVGTSALAPEVTVVHDPVVVVSDAADRDDGPRHAGRARYRDVLRRREFAGLLGAQVVSECGDQIARVALGSLVLARTQSAFLAAVTLAITFFAPVAGSMFLGVLADRMPRKVLMLGCDVLRAGVIAVLAWAAGSGVPVWALLLILLASEVLTAPFLAAFQASVPDALPDARSTLAGMGLMRLFSQLDQVLGIAFAGALVYFLGARVGLLVDAATFLLSFLLILVSVHWRPAARESQGVSAIRDLADGFRLLAGHAALRALVRFGCLSALFIVAPEAVALAYAKYEGVGTEVGALLLGAAPLGLTVGVYVTARWEPAAQIGRMFPLAIASAVLMLGVCVAPPWPVAAVLFAASGACHAFIVPLITTATLVTPAALRGQLSGVAGALFSLSSGLAFLGYGALADATTPAVSVTAAGVLGLLVIGLTRRHWPRRLLRRVARELYVA